MMVILLALICSILILGITQERPSSENPQKLLSKSDKCLPNIKFWQQSIIRGKKILPKLDKIYEMGGFLEEISNTELRGLIEKIFNIISINQSCCEYILDKYIYYRNKATSDKSIAALINSYYFLSNIYVDILKIGLNSLDDRVRSLGDNRSDNERTQREILYLEKIQFQRMAADIVDQKEDIGELEKNLKESEIYLEILKNRQ